MPSVILYLDAPYHKHPADSPLAPIYETQYRPPASLSVGRVSAFVSACQYYLLFLDGKRVGDHELDVAWTKCVACACECNICVYACVCVCMYMFVYVSIRVFMRV